MELHTLQVLSVVGRESSHQGHSEAEKRKKNDERESLKNMPKRGLLMAVHVYHWKEETFKSVSIYFNEKEKLR